MKQIIAYTSDNGNVVVSKKSKALAMDAEELSKAIAQKCYGDIGSYESVAAAKSLLQIVDKNVSPRRLMRMYSKLWRVRQAFLAALEEEKLTTEEA